MENNIDNVKCQLFKNNQMNVLIQDQLVKTTQVERLNILNKMKFIKFKEIRCFKDQLEYLEMSKSLDLLFRCLKPPKLKNRALFNTSLSETDQIISRDSTSQSISEFLDINYDNHEWENPNFDSIHSDANSIQEISMNQANQQNQKCQHPPHQDDLVQIQTGDCTQAYLRKQDASLLVKNQPAIALFLEKSQAYAHAMGSPKPVKVPKELQQQDWFCKNCFNINLNFRKSCRLCNLSKEYQPISQIIQLYLSQ